MPPPRNEVLGSRTSTSHRVREGSDPVCSSAVASVNCRASSLGLSYEYVRTICWMDAPVCPRRVTDGPGRRAGERVRTNQHERARRFGRANRPCVPWPRRMRRMLGDSCRAAVSTTAWPGRCVYRPTRTGPSRSECPIWSRPLRSARRRGRHQWCGPEFSFGFHPRAT